MAYYNAKLVKISFNQEVIKYQEKYGIFFLDVILHVLISYFQGYGETQNSLYIPYIEHEKHINEVFSQLNKCLIAKGSASLRGNKIHMKKEYSEHERTATIDYHDLDIKDAYPMTIAQYSRSIQKPDFQTLNIITGKGVHSLHGVSLSSGLVLYFSCKNNLDSVFLESNPGLQSFRIHRGEKTKSPMVTGTKNYSSSPHPL